MITGKYLNKSYLYKLIVFISFQFSTPRIDVSIEQGLYQNFFNQAKKFYLSYLKIGFKMYEDLNTLVDDHTFTKILEINNYETIFICFFGFNSLIFVVFLIHHLINYLISNLFEIKLFFAFCRFFCRFIWLKYSIKIFERAR